MTQLVHYVNEGSFRGMDEYLALIDDDESPEDYREPEYTISSIWAVTWLSGEHSALPTNRTFQES